MAGQKSEDEPASDIAAELPPALCLAKIPSSSYHKCQMDEIYACGYHIKLMRVQSDDDQGINKDNLDVSQSFPSAVKIFHACERSELNDDTYLK